MRRLPAPLVAAVLLVPSLAVPAEAGSAPHAPVGLARLLSAAPSGSVSAVATFEHPPGPADLAGLTRLGLTVQGLRQLPLALVFGPVDALRTAVRTGAARDVYPDERLRSYDDAAPEAPPPTPIRDSGRSIGVNVLHEAGITGKGVGVAVVDSGVDGTHPDLADHVAHNAKVIGPGYPGYPMSGPNFVLPVEATGNDSDVVNGHGTHVAGIVAADGTTTPDQVGVAPDASLSVYSVGELFIHSVLGAFDDILAHHAERGIRVVNNSWGTGFRFFDPEDPVNVATKALADAGIVVVFAAGNDAEEMTINPFSVAPWVISVGSNTLGRKRSAFSSGGLDNDNSSAVPGMLDGHRRFRGERVGLYHPDVSAPGTNITSSSSAPGLLTVPNPPCRGAISAPCTATLSGTSMAAPHVAGLAALLLQANPKLTPDQVRVALQATAAPMVDGSPLSRSGYGVVDARAADEVRRRGFAARLEALQRTADRRLAKASDHRVAIADHWGFTAPALAVAGSDVREFGVEVAPTTTAVKVAVAFPPVPPGVVPVSNRGGYELSLLDASGAELAKAEPGKAATTIVLVDLTDRAPAFGTWRLVLRSVIVVGPDSLAPDPPWDPPAVDAVTVAMTQLMKRR